jgi:DNA repair ATPase RecN
MQNGNALAVSASSITKDQGIASEKLEAAKKDLERLSQETKAAESRIEIADRQIQELRELMIQRDPTRNISELRSQLESVKTELEALRRTR